MKYAEHMRQAARDYLVALMAEHGGSVPRAAQAADVHRSTLYLLLERHAVPHVRRPPGRFKDPQELAA